MDEEMVCVELGGWAVIQRAGMGWDGIRWGPHAILIPSTTIKENIERKGRDGTDRMMLTSWTHRSAQGILLLEVPTWCFVVVVLLLCSILIYA